MACHQRPKLLAPAEKEGVGYGAGGSRVKNLAEKIAAIRERRERHKDMLV